MVEPLVVIVDGNRKHFLGVILADHIVVENFAYLIGGREAIARLHQRGFILLADDVHAQFNALVADKHGRTGNELAHLVLTRRTSSKAYSWNRQCRPCSSQYADQIQVITRPRSRRSTTRRR